MSGDSESANLHARYVPLSDTVDLHGVKLFIDDLMRYLGASRVECPPSLTEGEIPMYYMACCNSSKSAKWLRKRWDRYHPFRTASLRIRPRPFTDWLRRKSGSLMRSYNVGEDDLTQEDLSRGLVLDVTIKERSEEGTTLTVRIYDGEAEEDRYSFDDLRRSNLFGLTSDGAEQSEASNNEAVQYPRADFNFTDDDIRWLDEFSSYARNTMSGEHDASNRFLFLTHQLLVSYLGKAWVDRNFDFPKRGKKTLFEFSKGKDFTNYKALFRAIEFAELLYNFQETPGIREKVKEFRNNDVETALAELQGASLLYAPGRDLAFRPCSQVRGEDYDVDVWLSDGTVVACEIKSKIEETNLGTSTIKHTLDRARGQLPEDKPTAVIIKVPEHWFEDADAKATIEATTKDFFRQRSTVSAVFYHWEEWGNHPEHKAFWQLQVERYVNPNATHQHPELATLIPSPVSRSKRLAKIVGIPGMTHSS